MDPMRAQLVLSEAVLGLKRNLVMTVAAIVTVSISLALFGAALLVRQQVHSMQKYYYYNIEVSVFLTDTVTDAQRQDLLTTLTGLPLVKEVKYESKDEAYKRFKEQFKDQPDLVNNVSPGALPESYRVRLKDPTKYEVVASSVRGLPGVDQVVDQRKYLDKLFAVLNGLRNAALAIAGVQLLAATLLIANTVRVAAFNRRRETGIMKLVGASRLYIQLPFLLEGLVAGLIGALLGASFLGVAKVFLFDRTLGSLFSSGVIPAVHWSQIIGLTPVLAVFGVAIAGFASLVTLRRYVRV